MTVKFNDSTIFITGQAKPSSEDAINAMYHVFSLSLIIDVDSDIVLNLACNTIMDETEDFIRELICGKNFVTELDLMIETIRTRFYALVQKTLIVALKDAHNRYLMIYPEKRMK